MRKLPKFGIMRTPPITLLSISVVAFSCLVLPTPVLPFHSIYNFGDSLSDTGNFLASGASAFPEIGRFPYGETFFQRPTGRCSDGRLIIDFLAEASGLPYLPPYLSLKQGQGVGHGVNFAVAGATALDAKFFYDHGIGNLLWTNHSLSVQLGWFKKFKSSCLCTTTNNTQECENQLKKSLFAVGEIGGNDYNYAFFSGGSIKQVQALVPLVVQAICQAITILIEEGAVEMWVPGNLPFGCSAIYLTLFGGTTDRYEPRSGCLSQYNAFSRYHNNQLKQALASLARKHPHVRITYADYYGAAMRLYHQPRHYGFSSHTLLVACCGGGGPYNFNTSLRCGDTGSKVCNNPSTYINWDGIHFTEAAYRSMATILISHSFPTYAIFNHSVRIN